MTLERINNWGLLEAQNEFIGCCHCERRAIELAGFRPFASIEELFEKADSIWASATEDERLEAFSGHPQIGDIKTLARKYGNKHAANASREQGQIVEAQESVLIALRDGNQRYLENNGFIFIVCATGKSADEMLGLLRDRLRNDRETELDNAAREQGAITRLRLQKLIAEE